jgi:hypothetical protein
LRIACAKCYRNQGKRSGPALANGRSVQQQTNAATDGKSDPTRSAQETIPKALKTMNIYHYFILQPPASAVMTLGCPFCHLLSNCHLQPLKTAPSQPQIISKLLTSS